MGANKSGSTGKAITSHLDLVYPSKYVKAADLAGKDVTVVFVCAEWEDLVMVGGKHDKKAAITLETVNGKTLGKKLVAGKTVLQQIGAAVGTPIIGEWPGRRFTIYPTTCTLSRGEVKECIRVRGRVNERAQDVPEDMAKEPEKRADDASDAAGGAS